MEVWLLTSWESLLHAEDSPSGGWPTFYFKHFYVDKVDN